MEKPDEQAFESFIDQYATMLMKHAYLLTRHRQESEDLVQETLILVYKNWGRVQQAERTSSYVFRILFNEYMRGRRLRSVKEVLGQVEDRDVAVATETIDAADAFARMIYGLGPRPRAALILRYVDDYDDSEIARILGCRRATVRSLVKRALDHLRANRPMERGLK